jgi:hypothetical protein
MVVSTSRISFDVTILEGKRKTYTLQPTDTAYQFKEVIGYPPPDQVVLVYTRPSGKFPKLDDHKWFEAQGITSTHSDARVYMLLSFRAGGVGLSKRRRRGDAISDYRRFDGG